MRQLLSFFGPLLIVWSAAADGYLNYIFLQNHDIGWRSVDGSERPDLKSICPQMKYNYLEETEKLKRLNVELGAAAEEPPGEDQVARISNLKNAIHEATQHLIFLAKPEWNTENLEFTLSWVLPGDREIRIHQWLLWRSYYKGKITGATTQNLILNFQVVKRFDWYAEPQNYDETYWIFQYMGRGTYLELCQFIPTLEFELETKFEMLDFPIHSIFSQAYFLKGSAP